MDNVQKLNTFNSSSGLSKNIPAKMGIS